MGITSVLIAQLLIYICYGLGVPFRKPWFCKPKCVLKLTQSIEFLGFSVNSIQQELSLSAGKIKIKTCHLSVAAR